jgi:peptidoglycan hydrolase-like protein with peptidoglycan-binding domain
MKKYILIAALLFGLISVASAETYNFLYDMSVGSSSSDVASLQTVLINKGFDIPAISSGVSGKGYFGVQTKIAVIKYQASVGLPNTGYVGTLTRGKLNGNIASNHTPIINSLDAPVTLSVKQAGTWTVKATDPDNGQLTYAVTWGDVAIGCDPVLVNGVAQGCSPADREAMLLSPFVQSSTFTHTYSSPGPYTVKFVVKNASGNQASSSVTVNVTQNPGADVTVLSPNGGENWNINSVQAITWKLSDTFNSNAKVDLYLYSQAYPPVVCVRAPCGPFFGTPIYNLDKNISNTGAYNWIVGTDIVNNPIPRGSYGVKICVAGTDDCDYSDGTFTLTPLVNL